MLTEDNKDIFANYFQENADYYLEQMEGFKERGRYSFSGSAFFLGIFWMAYRKMYLQIAIIFGLIYAETFIGEMLRNLNVISFDAYEIIDKLSMLIWGIVIGSISNRLYISKSQKTVKKILDENTNQEQIIELLSKKGGINWIAPFILLVGLAGIVMMSLRL